MAKRTARTAAWSLLAGLMVAPVFVQAVVGVGAAVGTDWLLRWREARIEALAARGNEERDERLGRDR